MIFIGKSSLFNNLSGTFLSQPANSQVPVHCAS